MPDHAPVFITPPGVIVSFHCVNSTAMDAGWYHHMALVPRMGDVLRFRCTTMDCPNDHASAESQLLVAGRWRVDSVEIIVGCEGAEEDKSCYEEECACHKEETDDKEPHIVATTRYEVYLVPEPRGA